MLKICGLFKEHIWLHPLNDRSLKHSLWCESKQLFVFVDYIIIWWNQFHRHIFHNRLSYSINTVITFLRFLFLILVIKFVVERFASQLFRLFWNTAFENEERVKHRTWWYVTVLYIKIDNIPNMSSLFYNGSTRLSFNEILDDTKFIDWRSSNSKKYENSFSFLSNISC